MKSYFVFLSRHKLYTAIQAVGLIISIAFIILIGNYVWQQYRNAYSSKNIDRVYVVGCDQTASLSNSDKDILLNQLPGIEAAARFSIYGIWVNFEQGAIEASSIYTDPDFFEIFPEFELIAGNKKDFIPGSSCVISEKFANTYFQGKSPVGENIPNRPDMRIAGIYKINGNSIAREADIIRFMSDQPEKYPFKSIGNTLTFIKVPENYDRVQLLEEIIKVERPHYSESWIKEFKLFSIPELYFNGEYQLKKGDKTLMNILLGVVILLLLSSFINYVNLSMAQSGDRMKEISTRRLLGASKTGVILRNMSESVLFVFICGAISIGLAYIFRPLIDDLLINVSIDTEEDNWRVDHLLIKWNVSSIFITVGFFLLLGILAGLLPSLVSARQQPIDIIKGSGKVKYKMVLGKAFIILQNVISVILISLSIVMESQLNHIHKQPLFANEKNIFLLEEPVENVEEVAYLIDNIAKISGVKKIGVGSNYPEKIYSYTGVKIGKENSETVPVGVMMGDRDYFQIMGLHLLDSNHKEGENIVFISESLANLFKNEEIDPESYFSNYNYNGIHFSSFGGVYKDTPRRIATVIDPNPYSYFLLSRKEDIRNMNMILIEVNEESSSIKDEIIEDYHKYTKEKWGFETDPLRYDFISIIRYKSLISVRSTIVLLEIFMGLSVMISLLGLIAMSTYYANENTKVIAIRKVLGSDVKDEIWRNIRLYMILVLIAIAIAIPLSIVISREYLSRFAYRIENYWWIFLVASIGSLLIAFLSVYWQISRSAHINPAIELKKE